MSFSSQTPGLTALQDSLVVRRSAPVTAVVATVDGVSYYFSSGRMPREGIQWSYRLRQAIDLAYGVAGFRDSGQKPEFRLGDLRIRNDDAELVGLVGKSPAVTVYQGAAGMPFSDFEVISDSESAKPIQRDGADLVLSVTHLSEDLQQPIERDRYLAYGGAYRDTAATGASGASAATLDVDGSLTIIWIGKVDSLPSSSQLLLRRTTGYRLIAEPDGEFSFYHLGTAGAATITSNAGGQLLAYRMLAATVDGDQVRLYAGASPWDLAQVGSGQTKGEIFVDTGAFILAGAGSSMVADVWEAELRSDVLDLEQLRARFAGRSAPPYDAATMDLWRCEEGTGDTLYSALERVDLSSTGHEWVSTVTGDDPVVWGGGLEGLSRQYSIGGRLFNVEAVPVDRQRQLRHLNDAGIARMRQVRIDGVPAERRLTLTCDSAGDIEIRTGDIIEIVSSSLDGISIIPAQQKPGRLGQRLEISGSASNDGTYQVDTVTADGTMIKVLADGGAGPAGLTVESLPKNASVATPDADWRYDDATSYGSGVLSVRLEDDDASVITADFRTSAHNERDLSSVWEEIAGQAPDVSALDWQPDAVAVIEPPASEVRPVDEILYMLARSAGCWWWRSPSGADILVPRVKPLAEDATISILPWHIDGEIEEGDVDARPREVSVRFQRNATQQESFGGSVPSNLRRKYSEPWNSVSVPVVGARADGRVEVVETGITLTIDARELARREAAYFAHDHRGLTVPLCVPLPVFPGDVVTITSRDKHLDLNQRPMRVLFADRRAGAGETTTLELYG